MKVAVIGTGISGLVAADRLCRAHEVVLFEAAARVGGHTNTVVVEEAGRPIPIDTGFIVFNTKTYPRFVAWLRELGVAWVSSDMSFGVRSARRDFEYAATSLRSLFAQRRNAVRPAFYRMLVDLVRFYGDAKRAGAADASDALRPWLEARGYSRAFIDDHLMPMTRAVWSADRDTADAFPVAFLARFFEQHGFLELRSRPQWLTIAGGAHSYIRAMLSRFRGTLRTSTPVASLRRERGAILLTTADEGPERFDHIVVACHAPDALRMLDRPSRAEQELLGAFRYQSNVAVLHTDARHMPRRRAAWASWNVDLDAEDVPGAAVTYWMNRLQPLDATVDYFVTLNPRLPVAPNRELARFAYAHPLFTTAAVRAQRDHEVLVAHEGISYCGAYWRNGFHEDGVVSAERIVAAVARRRDGASYTAAHELSQ